MTATDTETLRRAVIDTARAMGEVGLNQGRAGNLSVRVADGFLITPSGMAYAQMKPDDIVHMDLDGTWRGHHKPSSEWRFHRDLYAARADAGAVLHAHAPHCTALACLNRSIPAFHYMVAVAGGADIRCAPYATFGSQALSDHALAALTDRKACLLAHHGLLCLDDDLAGVLELAVEVENLAQVYSACLAIGTPDTLPADEMSRVLEKFKSYGANAQ